MFRLSVYKSSLRSCYFCALLAILGTFSAYLPPMIWKPYPGYIWRIHFRAPIEVYQPLVPILFAAGVDQGDMALTGTFASFCLTHCLSVGALRDSLFQYATYLSDCFQPAEVGFLSPVVLLALPAFQFLPKFFHLAQDHFIRLLLGGVVLNANCSYLLASAPGLCSLTWL